MWCRSMNLFDEYLKRQKEANKRRFVLFPPFGKTKKEESAFDSEELGEVGFSENLQLHKFCFKKESDIVFRRRSK